MTTRCHVASDAWAEESLTFDRATAHHLARVLRVRPGDALELFNGLGEVAEAEVSEVTGSTVRASVGARRSSPRPQPHITLVQALIRPQHMDLVMRKATELGVSAIQPVITDRCVARTKDRPDRWVKTLISAAEQCGANWLPELWPVRNWSDVLADAATSYDRTVICALSGDTRPLKDVLRADAAISRVAALIGPEGDFTPDELSAALEAGAIPVSLGALTLRAETAALAVMAAFRYEFG